jgi:competence ComEA-like helix-hairpin-helix protein
MRYTRPQLRLLLVLAVVMLLGLVIREWRAGFPDLAERLERFDREEPVDPPSPRPWAAASRPSASASRPGPPAPRRPGAMPRARGNPDVASGHDDGFTPGAAETLVSRPVDVNRAAEPELARLPGLGTSLARRIVEERERHGAFASPEALRRVYGLGPRKLAAIRDHVTVTAAAAPDAPHADSPALLWGSEGATGERAPERAPPEDDPSGDGMPEEGVREDDHGSPVTR